jgi:hypothetical protein
MHMTIIIAHERARKSAEKTKAVCKSFPPADWLLLAHHLDHEGGQRRLSCHAWHLINSVPAMQLYSHHRLLLPCRAQSHTASPERLASGTASSNIQA